MPTEDPAETGSRSIELRLAALEKRLDAVVDLLQKMLALLIRVAGKP